MSTTLVLYVLHEFNDNVEYFIKYGLKEENNVKYVFVINSPSIKIPIQLSKNIEIINRENIGHDFGAWSHYLLSNSNYKNYDMFILLNSTVRGPFKPVWDKSNWITNFTSNITNDLKLFGTTIGLWKGIPHIQSMFFCMDKIGMEICVKHNIFSKIIIQENKQNIIRNKEIRMSEVFISEQYNIGCLLKPFENMDFRKVKFGNDIHFCPYLSTQYFGIDIHPYEVIFIKYLFCNKKQNEKINEWFTKKFTNEFASKFTNEKVHKTLNLDPVENKYLLIDLNPNLTSGLTNQLWSLIMGKMIAKRLNRTVHTTGFYPNYNNSDKIPLSQILNMNCDMDTTQVYVKSKYFNPTKNSHKNEKQFKLLCEDLKRENKTTHLFIGDVFSVHLYKYFKDENETKEFDEELLSLDFKLNPKEIKNGFHSIHLRLEDDAMNLTKNFTDLILRYSEEIEKLDNSPIYVCTHLLKSKNMFDYVLTELKHRKNVILNHKTDRGREIDALEDLLTASKCKTFIGFSKSTFSCFLKLIVERNGGKAILI